MNFEVALPQPNAETLAAADEVRGQIASGEKGTDDADAFFAGLET